MYQAYAPQIARPAVVAGRFVEPFKRDRMTWVKPSFRWMMYRCGWATKPGQEHVLAIDITWAGFEWALARACLSYYDPDIRIRDLLLAGEDQAAAALPPAERAYPLRARLRATAGAGPAEEHG